MVCIPLEERKVDKNFFKGELEVHGWELPKFFADLETWQRKQRRRGYSCALHRLNIRKNRSKICVDFKKKLLT